jgi:hypothetical protein
VISRFPGKRGHNKTTHSQERRFNVETPSSPNMSVYLRLLSFQTSLMRPCSQLRLLLHGLATTNRERSFHHTPTPRRHTTLPFHHPTRALPMFTLPLSSPNNLLQHISRRPVCFHLPLIPYTHISLTLFNNLHSKTNNYNNKCYNYRPPCRHNNPRVFHRPYLSL